MIGYSSSKLRAVHVALGSLVMLFASPALADCGITTTALHTSKAEAILGGAPSRLAEIQARQSGIGFATYETPASRPIGGATMSPLLRPAVLASAQPSPDFGLNQPLGAARPVFATLTLLGITNVPTAILSPSSGCAMPAPPRLVMP